MAAWLFVTGAGERNPKMTDVGVLRWVEDLVGGTIIRKRRQGRWRPQWYLDVSTAAGEQLPLFLRSSRDPQLAQRSHFLSHFSIEHEAAVLRALQDTPVLVPRYYGFHDGSKSILLEQVPGTEVFATLTDRAERQAIARQYMENLAILHRLDPETLGLGNLRVPRTPEEIALANKFSFVEMDYQKAPLGPEPLLNYGRWWLKHHVPRGCGRISLLQGDTGPNQFMFDAGRVTALIDWELAHIGDPMLDLGVMRMRDLLYPMEDLNEHYQYYADRAGFELDFDAIRYYTVLSMLLSPMGMASTIQAPDARIPSMIQRFAWDGVLRRGLCEALMEVTGIAVDPPEIPDALETPRSKMHDLLVETLRKAQLEAAGDEYDKYEMRAAIGLAASLQLAERVGPVLDRHDLEDLAEMLGRRPADRETGLAQLDKLVATDPEGRTEGLLRLFYRMEFRRGVMLKPLMIENESRPLAALG
jgi:aminoglycoside phosphotransferase (APT) family kinase protein